VRCRSDGSLQATTSWGTLLDPLASSVPSRHRSWSARPPGTSSPS